MVYTNNKNSVKVGLRIRPLIGTELLSPQIVIKYPFKNQICLNDKNFSFDYVFNEDIVTSDVFQEAVMPLKNSFLSGYNCTIFAYGQTVFL